MTRAHAMSPPDRAELLRAFAHPTRLAILSELLAGVRCVTDIEDLVPAAQANISQHLTVLRHAGLVSYARDGALRCYYLARPKLVRGLFRILAAQERPVTKTKERITAEKRRRARRAESACR